MERVVRGHAKNPGIFALEGASGGKAQRSHCVDGETEAQSADVTWPGSLSEVVAGSWTPISSQGPFGGTRCPFWFSVSRSLCPNSIFGKTCDISIQRSWLPRRCLLRPKEPGTASPSSRGSVASRPRMGWLSFPLSLSLSLLHFCESNDELTLPHFSLLLHILPTKGGSATLLVSGR